MRFPSVAVPASALARSLRRFWRDESGNAVIESVFMLPLVIWVSLFMINFWSGYQTKNKLQKASYTVSDILSRWQGAPLTPTDANGLQTLMTYLIDERDQTPAVRISSIIWVAARNRYEVQWSCALDPNFMPQLTTASLQTHASRLPMGADGSTQILVETSFSYSIFRKMIGQEFGTSVTSMTFDQFIPVRPRFSAVTFNNPNGCN